MIQRSPVFPNVIEMNYQARQRFGCNIYLVFEGDEWVLIDIGYDDAVEEVVELIRQLDFPLSNCKALIATHPDVDHSQGLAKAKQIFKAPVLAHPKAIEPLESGDRLLTFAQIEPQNIDYEMPPVTVDRGVEEGETVDVGSLKLEVWHTPGHTPSQLALRMGNLLFSGDNIFRDGCVGAIDAHHGSDIPAFIRSLKRIKDSDEVEWLLPSHGPIFAKDKTVLQETIERLESYKHMADFGTCAVDWPLMDQWEQELAEGRIPGK